MKFIHAFNFVGVLALTGLCLAQWTRDRQLNLEINRLEQVRLDQTSKIADLEQAIAGLKEDLAQIKNLYNQSQTELAETRKKLRGAEAENILLVSERDQLKASVARWTEAVAVRDARITEANEHIRKLSDDLNGAILKFNELATNYNAVVKDLNALRSKPPKPQGNP